MFTDVYLLEVNMHMQVDELTATCFERQSGGDGRKGYRKGYSLGAVLSLGHANAKTRVTVLLWLLCDP